MRMGRKIRTEISKERQMKLDDSIIERMSKWYESNRKQDPKENPRYRARLAREGRIYYFIKKGML